MACLLGPSTQPYRNDLINPAKVPGPELTSSELHTGDRYTG
jgi:hypothetical protein